MELKEGEHKFYSNDRTFFSTNDTNKTLINGLCSQLYNINDMTWPHRIFNLINL